MTRTRKQIGMEGLKIKDLQNEWFLMSIFWQFPAFGMAHWISDSVMDAFFIYHFARIG